MKALFALFFRSHELFVPGDGLKDAFLPALADGISVGRPCRRERLPAGHEENENCLTLKTSVYIKDFVNRLGHDPMVTAFFKDWNLNW
jgi:hypothetical protein